MVAVVTIAADPILVLGPRWPGPLMRPPTGPAFHRRSWHRQRDRLAPPHASDALRPGCRSADGTSHDLLPNLRDRFSFPSALISSPSCACICPDHGQATNSQSIITRETTQLSERNKKSRSPRSCDNRTEGEEMALSAQASATGRPNVQQGGAMAKRHGRLYIQYRYEHYDPRMYR